MHDDRRITHTTYGVYQERNASDMIQVGVRDEDVINLLQIGQRQISDSSPSVDQDVVV
jgi:hypothetical protein